MTDWIAKQLFGGLHVIGKTLSSGYSLLAGPLDHALAKRQDAALAEDVSREWTDLLLEHQGKVSAAVPGRTRTQFDYAMCQVEFDELAVQVVRGRGEIRVQVASLIEPEEWFDLSLLLRKIAGQNSTPLRADESLGAVGQALRMSWKAVSQCLSSSHFAETKRDLSTMSAMS